MSRISRDSKKKGWVFEGFQSQGESISKEPGDMKWRDRARVGLQRCGVKMHWKASLGGRLELTMKGKEPRKVSEVKGFVLVK